MRKEKAARGGPKKSFSTLENKPESSKRQAPSAFMRAFAEPCYVQQAGT
jgi:hypothetical protein